MKIIKLIDKTKWYVFSIYLVFLASPILTNKELVGWDLTPHLRLADNLAQNILSGFITSYDFAWSAGYPLFSLYPPGGHIVLGLLRFLSGNEHKEIFTNIFLVLLCWLVIHSLYHLTKEMFSKQSAIFALLLSPLWLCLGPELGPFGVGLHGLISAGLVPSTFALVLFHYFTVCLMRAERRPGLRYPIFSGVLLGAIILSHSLTAFLAIGLTTIFLFRLRVQSGVALVSVASVMSLPWLLEFLKHVTFQTANSIVFLSSVPDPLFVFLPGFLPKAGQSLLDIELSSIPWKILTLIFLVAIFLAVKDLLTKRRYLWPALWFFGLLFLTRSIFFILTLLPLHYYRFAGPLLSLALAFAAHGVFLALEHASHKTAKIATILALLCIISFQFDLRAPAYATGNIVPTILDEAKQRIPLTKDEAGDWPRIAELKRVLSEGGGCPRVAVESSTQLLTTTGTPHSITTELVRDSCTEALPGLLSESTLTQPWILSALFPGSEVLFWGVSHSQFRWAVRDQLKPSLERFRALGVEGIVAVSKRYQMTLDQYVSTGELTRVPVGSWRLYRLSHPSSRALTVGTKPILFVSDAKSKRGQLKAFQNFLNWMWQYDTLVNRIVILSPPISELNGKLLGEFSQVILDSDVEIEGTDLESALMQGKLPYRKFGCDRRVGECHIFNELKALSLWIASEPEPKYETATISISNNKIEVAGGNGAGLLVKYGYSPRWRADKTTIFLANPSFMYLPGVASATIDY